MNSSRTVRIFFSSTFRDFGEERDLLVRQVFPALRARLKDRFVELVDVDLRWGITAEQAERGEVIPICLAEIDRARPYFVGMLGERYGWIPPSDGYALDLLERHAWLRDHRGDKSVTELEILHGVLNDPSMAGRAFFYFRSADYAESKGGDYVPSLEEDRLRQRQLKDKIRESGFQVMENYPNPKAFASKLEEDLWQVLDESFPADDVPDEFERESRRHEAYAVPRRRLYLGGDAYSTALTNSMKRGQQRILIEGQSGGGKSALIANWVQTFADKKDDVVIFEHFTAATADAAQSSWLVRRLIDHIKRTTGSNDDIPEDPAELLESLPYWLGLASAWGLQTGRRWVFTIDALNGLTDSHQLRWFPEFLPEGIHFVISSLPCDTLNALASKGHWQRLLVNPLTADEGKKLLTSYLSRYNKILSDDLVRKVLAHPLSTNPLFLRTVAEELRLFGVHEQLTEHLDYYLSSQTVDDLFERVLERVEGDCGQELVKASLEAIWASRSGLTEQEIQKLCRLAPVEWAKIRAALDDALLESMGRISFAHDYMRIAVSDRYLMGDNTLEENTQSHKAKLLRQKLHERLANWFECEFLSNSNEYNLYEKALKIPEENRLLYSIKNLQKTVTPFRASEEVPYQWMKAKNWNKLRSVLTNVDIFEAIYSHSRSQELLSHWTVLGENISIDIEEEYKLAWNDNVFSDCSKKNLRLIYDLSNFFLKAGRYSKYIFDKLEQYEKNSRKIDFDDHELNLNIKLNLAEYFRGSANYKKAIKIFKKLMNSKIENVELKSKIYSQYAQLNCAIGNYEQSTNYFKKAIRHKSRLLGGSHESVFDTKRELAWNMYVSGDFKSSLNVNLRMKKNYNSLLKYDELSYSMLLNNIGLIYYNIGNTNQAKINFDDEEVILRKYLGNNNWSVPISIINRAWLKELLNQFDESRNEYFLAKSILVDQFGENHPTVSIAYGNLAWNSFQCGNMNEAYDQFCHAIDICSMVLDEKHLDCTSHYEGLGLLFLKQEKYDLAAKYFDKSSIIYQSNFGQNHPNLSILYNYMSTLTAMKDNQKKSFQYDKKSFSMLLNLNLKNTLDMARIANGYSISLYMNSYVYDAMRLQQYSIKIFKKYLGINHPDTKLAIENLEIMKRLSGTSHKKYFYKRTEVEFFDRLKNLKYRDFNKAKLFDAFTFKRLFKTRRYMGTSTM